MTRSIHFGVFLLGTGNHTAGWRYPGADKTFLDIRVLQRVAAIAERGLFDFLFLGDGLSANLRGHPSYTCRLEPLTLLSALSVTTTHVGLAATMSTTYSDPYTVARIFGSLDHISGGRAAWNAVTSAAADSGGNFGRTHPDHEKRYEIAEEFITVVRGLWDCWGDDAIIADLATGKFFDQSKVKALNHEGQHFSVKGPINMGRSPQGQPLVLQAGGSERGQNLAARTADVVFSVVQDFEEAKGAYAGLKDRIRRFGRNPDHVTILPGVMPIVGKTDAQAREILNTLQSAVELERGAGDAVVADGRRRLEIPARRADPGCPCAGHVACLRPDAARQGEAREYVTARPLQPHRRGARTLGPVRFRADDRRYVREVVR